LWLGYLLRPQQRLKHSSDRILPLLVRQIAVEVLFLRRSKLLPWLAVLDPVYHHLIAVGENHTSFHLAHCIGVALHH
jgi:hypothetical protein